MKFPLPERLRSARKMSKLTQEDISNELGYDRSHGTARISQYETGRHAPDFTMAKRISEVLGIPVAYLYCDDDDLAKLLLVASKLSKAELDTYITEMSNIDVDQASGVSKSSQDS